MYANKFHVSISICRIYQRSKSNNNDAQNTSTYPKGIIQFANDLGVSAHVRKNFPRLCICENNPVLVDFVIQNHYKEFLRTYAKNFHVSIKKLRICASSNNPIVDVLRPAQKLQVWNTYIPASWHIVNIFGILTFISRINFTLS